MPAFRVGFYEILREKLAAEGILLDLIYAPNQRNTFVTAEVAWATQVPLHWLGGRVGWQPVLRHCRGRDLVIIQQETKYVVNPILQLWSKIGGPKIAYWGHGRNFQSSDRNCAEEKIKRWLSKHVDWWFAYNRLSADAVKATGFSPARITEVNNAIDTRTIRQTRDITSVEALNKLRSCLKLDSCEVTVYTGGIYPLKRIPFLLEAANLIRLRIPNFHLIIIGQGPDSKLVEQAAVSRPWLHFVGAKSDKEKVPYWMLSKLLLMPGGVGLVVLDSLALGVPMITTANNLHGPEIDYLRDGENGLVVNCGEDASAYADAVVRLLQDDEELKRMAKNAERDGKRYSFEAMATNFAEGVTRCLGNR
jgi:glycosyltransferase involved in cell wall biosynthesis